MIHVQQVEDADTDERSGAYNSKQTPKTPKLPTDSNRSDMPKPLPGPSRLSQILQNLNKAPRATLIGVKSITLTLAQRNDHFGAR